MLTGSISALKPNGQNCSSERTARSTKRTELLSSKQWRVPDHSNNMANKLYGLVLLLAFCAALLPSGCSPNRLKSRVGLGATISECNAFFGTPTPVPEILHRMMLSNKQQSYHSQSKFVCIGFDAQDKAESFVFANIPDTPMNQIEQASLLDNMKGQGGWQLIENPANGPIWQKSDDKAYASYVLSSHLFVFMTEKCMEKFIDDLPNYPSAGNHAEEASHSPPSRP